MLSAISLKAMVHERKGEVVEALECAERIVELNPNSELDKIKRNQLRSALASLATHSSPPNRFIPFVAAVSVSLILVCVAVLAAHYLDRPQSQVRIASNAPMVSGFNDRPGNPTINPNPVDAPSQSAKSPAPVSQAPVSTNPPVATKAEDSESSNDSGVGEVRAQTQDGGLPNVNRSQMEVTPISPPNLPASSTQMSTVVPSSPSTPARASLGDPAPAPDSSRGGSVGSQAPFDPGQVSITIHDSPGVTPRSSGGSEANTDTSKMYYKMGTDSFLIGNFDRAADRFEKALSSGADPVTGNERLAQSYANLGRKREAENAYKRAIAACSSELSSGKGDSTKLRAVRDACETAMHQMQGG
jgi:tetratricopeptide (TPR) repeat protein